MAAKAPAFKSDAAGGAWVAAADGLELYVKTWKVRPSGPLAHPAADPVRLCGLCGLCGLRGLRGLRRLRSRVRDDASARRQRHGKRPTPHSGAMTTAARHAARRASRGQSDELSGERSEPDPSPSPWPSHARTDVARTASPWAWACSGSATTARRQDARDPLVRPRGRWWGGGPWWNGPRARAHAHTRAALTGAHGDAHARRCRNRNRLGEHINRYNHVFPAFAAAGICVTGYDQRGFGRSDGLRGDGGVYDNVMADGAVVWDHAVQAHPDVPHFVGGHSLGGLHALSFAAMYAGDRKIAGVVASAPALQPGFRPPWIITAIGNLLKGIPVVNQTRVPTELSTPRALGSARHGTRRLTADTSVRARARQHPRVASQT